MIAASGNFGRARQGLFHYGYWAEATIGQSNGVPGPSFYAGGGSSRHLVAAHELGHNLGLWHGGTNQPEEMNHKSAYPSIMNYAFAYSMPGGTTDQPSRFSEGRMEPIDYRSMTETAYSAAGNAEYLTGSPFNYFALAECINEDAVTRQNCVDFNHDRRFTEQGVMYDPAHQFGSGAGYLGIRYGGAQWPDLHDLRLAGPGPTADLLPPAQTTRSPTCG
jgi:hypothetical protein